jgi:hypothetical protein
MMDKAIEEGATADEAEAMAIEQIQQLGAAVLTDWARLRFIVYYQAEGDIQFQAGISLTCVFIEARRSTAFASACREAEAILSTFSRSCLARASSS